METLCRVCIKKAAECTSLNTKIENSSKLSFFDFLNKCTSLNACETDKLPQGLCSICTNRMKTFYSFVKLAEKSDTILRETLKTSIATERYNDNRELTCEEITIKSEKIEEGFAYYNKADSIHRQASTNATGSSLYILDIVKEEPRISESTSVAKINESDEFHSNLDHPEGGSEEPDDILSCLDGHPASTDDISIYLLQRSLVTNKKTDSQKTKIEYEDHIRIGHGCRNQVSSEAADDSLKPHLRGWTENTYKCIECDMVFNDREEFRTHCRNHIYGDKHECSICGKKFATRSYLQSHLLTHDEKKKYKCSICEKDFKHALIHWEHMKKHRGEMPFECETCGKNSCLKALYESPLNISYACSQCGKVYKVKKNLLSQIDEKSCKKHKCEICSKIFKKKSYLKRHMENHSGIIKKCGLCDKEFKSSDTLRKHVKWHTNPKPFICEKSHECMICGKKFRGKHLKDHMESHDGVTKKCDQCDKEFKYTKGLRRHMKWHTNPKPFKCESCGKLFARKCTCTRHMEICKSTPNSNEGTIKLEESSFH